MTRREKATLPEPPWVWGPSEVNEWIRAAYPSKKRRGRSARKGPEIITRLRVLVVESDARRVRTVTEEALKSVGLGLVGPTTGWSRHRVAGVFRRSLVRGRVHVALRFTPPIHESSCKRIVERIGEEARILRVSVQEERARLSKKSK